MNIEPASKWILQRCYPQPCAAWLSSLSEIKLIQRKRCPTVNGIAQPLPGHRPLHKLFVAYSQEKNDLKATVLTYWTTTISIIIKHRFSVRMGQRRIGKESTSVSASRISFNVNVIISADSSPKFDGAFSRLLEESRYMTISKSNCIILFAFPLRLIWEISS